MEYNSYFLQRVSFEHTCAEHPVSASLVPDAGHDRNETWSWPPEEPGACREVSLVLRHCVHSLTHYGRDGKDGPWDRNSAVLPLEGSAVGLEELVRVCQVEKGLAASGSGGDLCV